MKIFTTDESILTRSEAINRLIKLLFLSSLILIPFDDLPYFDALGGLGKRAAIYPYFFIIILFIYIYLHKRKIIYNHSIEKTLILSYYFWVIISSLTKFSVIYTNTFKGQTGFKRMLIQLASLTLLMLIMYFTEIIIESNKITFNTLRFFICLSFIPVSIVGIIEVLNIFKVIDFSNILEFISSLINSVSRSIFDTSRSRGVNAEPSYLGMYCAFIFPWFFSYIFTSKSIIKKVLSIFPLMLIVVLVVTTKSRTASILLIFELVSLLSLVLLFYSNTNAKLYTTIIVVFLGISINITPKLLTSLTTIKKPPVVEETNKPAPLPNKGDEYNVNGIVTSISDNNNMSNIARQGMQKAALKMGLENPIVGVGIGQYGFHFTNYIVETDLRSPEVQFWSDPSKPDWPSVHSLYHRIFAEEGFIGLAIYISFIFIVSFKLFIKVIKERKDIVGISLLVSYASILIGSLTLDQYVLPHFWIMSSIVILYTNNKIKILNT